MAGDLGTQEWRKLCAWAKSVMEPVCHVCGQEIDLALPGRDSRGWSLDHLLPRKTHPELAFDPSNVRPAHLGCNSRKGAGATPRRPRSSRSWG